MQCSLFWLTSGISRHFGGRCALHLTQLCANLELSCRRLHGSAAKVHSFITSSMDIETVLRSVATRAGLACPKKSLEQTCVFCVKHA